MGFPLFPRNIQYRERLKGSLLVFLDIVRLFSQNISKGSLLHFLMFCNRMDVEKSQRGPFFRHCQIFRKKITRWSPFNFSMFCDRMDVEKSERVPLQFFFGIKTFKRFFGCCRREYFDTLKSFCFF